MTQSIKQLTILPLMVVLLCSTPAELEARHKDNGLGGFLIGAGCAVVGGLIGMAAYNACQSPSDSEELSSGQHLLSDARHLQSKYAARYQKDCSLIASVDQLKHSVLHGGSRKSPYTKYTSTLRSNISNTQGMISDLINKKNHLFERKMELAHNDDLSCQERRNYTEQYDNLIENISKQVEILQAMNNDLRRLETTLVGLPEYREEQLIEQVNRLEDKLDRMNRPVCVWGTVAPVTPPVIWCEPEPTVVLHGNINLVEPAPVVVATPPACSWGVGVSYSYSE